MMRKYISAKIDEFISDSSASTEFESWEFLLIEDWEKLILAKPEFCDKAKLYKEGWCALLILNSQLTKECPDWNFTSAQCFALLLERPELIEYCKTIHWITGVDWAVLLAKYPQLSDKCDMWQDFDSYCWEVILSAQPQFADRCFSWEDFESDVWISLLTAQPQFAERCDKYDEFSYSDWLKLVSKNQIFVEYAKKYKHGNAALAVMSNNISESVCENFSPSDWVEILITHPELAKICDAWNLFSVSDWLKLLNKQPQFADKNKVLFDEMKSRCS